MARYIDADKELYNLSDDLPYKASVKRVLMQAPEADVAEVRHGEWVIKSETTQTLDDVDEVLYVECPFCQRTFYVPFEFEDKKILEYARKHYPYCHCGAKMDKGVTG